MLIAAYYIDRSCRLSPCWDVANTLKEAKIKAKKWAIESHCWTSIKSLGKTICRYNENGEEV